MVDIDRLVESESRKTTHNLAHPLPLWPHLKALEMFAMAIKALKMFAMAIKALKMFAMRCCRVCAGFGLLASMVVGGLEWL